MTEEIEIRPDEQEMLREMNRYADLMVERGLAALFLRELIAVRQPGAAALAEWQAFVKENVSAGGGFVGSIIPQEYWDAAAGRADEVISKLFSDAAH